MITPDTANAHLRNAWSLFTPEALEFAANRLVLPAPLPLAIVNIDPAALVQAAKGRSWR